MRCNSARRFDVGNKLGIEGTGEIVYFSASLNKLIVLGLAFRVRSSPFALFFAARFAERGVNKGYGAGSILNRAERFVRFPEVINIRAAVFPHAEEVAAAPGRIRTFHAWPATVQVSEFLEGQLFRRCRSSLRS